MAMFVYQRVTILYTEINFSRCVRLDLQSWRSSPWRLDVFMYLSWWRFRTGWGVGVGGKISKISGFLSGDGVGDSWRNLFCWTFWVFWSCWAWNCKGRDARRLSSDPPCITVKYIHPEIILKWKLCCFLSWSRVVPIMRMSCLAIQCPFALKQSINSDLGRYVCKLFRTFVTKAMRKIWVWDVELISASSSR